MSNVGSRATSIPVRLLALALLLLTACGGRLDAIEVPSNTNNNSATCQAQDYQAAVVAFCETQNPPAPGAGERGASCADDTQCSSGLCLEPFGSAAYCTVPCPNGGECGQGYSCQDSGTVGPVCYQGVCVYGGSDKAACVSALTAEIEEGCRSACTGPVNGWVRCLAGAGRLCGVEDADQACGAERGLLESCCPGCSRFEW